MRRTLCIAVAAVAISCGGEQSVPNVAQTDGSSRSMAQSTPKGDALPPTNSSDHESSTSERTTSPGNQAMSDQLISLTGCLKGDEIPAGASS